MLGIMARMVPSQALTASLPEAKDRGAFMSINSSIQQLAVGVAAMIGALIITQKDSLSPLERFDILGYVVIAVILANIFLTWRVYKIIRDKSNLE